MGLGNNIMQSSLFLTSPAYNITRFASESCMLSVLLATFDALFEKVTLNLKSPYCLVG